MKTNLHPCSSNPDANRIAAWFKGLGEAGPRRGARTAEVGPGWSAKAGLVESPRRRSFRQERAENGKGEI
jgi:hypothetical protein